MTGGMDFVKGESSIRKVKCRRTTDGDLEVLSHTAFARDLFEAVVHRKSPDGMALDVGGDHVWADDSGKYLWASTFRMGNSGVHMLDYETGDLIYSVHGMDSYLTKNYAYSSGIDGSGYLGQQGAFLLAATSACTTPRSVCAPFPFDPITKALDLEARGVMYIIDLSELMNITRSLVV